MGHMCARLGKQWLRSLLRMRARAKMIVKGGVCTAGCDNRELCVRVCTPRIIQGLRG